MSYNDRQMATLIKTADKKSVTHKLMTFYVELDVRAPPVGASIKRAGSRNKGC